MIVLSPQQDDALKKVSDWYYKTNDQVFVLAGYAGTGKSTVITKLKNEMGLSFHYCAFTGKAASVLREKGLAATTLHSAIYLPKEKSQQRLKELQAQLLATKDEKEVEKLTRQINAEKDNLLSPTFSLNLESEIKNVDIVVIDEYSMLDERILQDLFKLAKRVIALGDPGQLPPIKGKCPLRPDVFLTEVHRQALDSPILWAATQAREGKRIDFCDLGEFKKVRRSQLEWEQYREADQLIVAKNKTRQAFNKRFRERLGFNDRVMYDYTELPQIGEKIICLKNNIDEDIFNGMIETVESAPIVLDEDSFTVEIREKPLQIWSGSFFNPWAKPEIWQVKEFNLFDFAYAITCHKSQGSEFDSVVVYDEGFPYDYEKWLYTAITRAKEKLIIVDPN